MKESDYQKALDAIADYIIENNNLNDIFRFAGETIGDILGIGGVFFTPLELENRGLLILDNNEKQTDRRFPIVDGEKLWGHLNLIGRGAINIEGEETEKFIDRIIKLIRIALQKTSPRERRKPEREKKNLHPNLDKLKDELHYAEIVSSAPVPLFQADTAGNCFYVNSCWTELTGFSPEETYGLGWVWAIHPEDREPTFSAWQLFQPREQLFRHEVRVRCQDNTLRWMYVQILPRWSDREEGKIVSYLGVLTDITNFKQIERTSREKQQQLTAITANVPVGLYSCILHVDGRITVPYASAGFERLLGVDPQLLTIYPKLLFSRVHPEDRQKIKEHIGKIRSAPPPIDYQHRLDFRAIDRSGEMKWLRDHANFSLSDTGDLIVNGVTIDISEQKKAQAKSDFQAEILDRVHNAVIATDTNGKIIYFNRYARELFLLDDSWLNSSIEALIPPESSEQAGKILETLADRRLWSGELPLQRTDGTKFTAGIVNTAIEDESGRIYTFVGVISDVSDLRQLESAIRLIAKGVSSETEQAFLRSLAEYLNNILGMDYALIGALIPGTNSIGTIAVYGDGALLDNIIYDLEGTPCENVIEGEVCYYPEGIQTLFPEDRLLVEMGVQSYLGTPLINSRGQTIGLIAVLNRQPTRENTIAVEILQIFASRAAAELERQAVLKSLKEMNERLEERVEERTRELAATVEQLNQKIREGAEIETALRESEWRYRHLVTMIPYGVQENDPDGLITFSNPAHARMYGYEPGTVAGTYIWDRLTRDEDRETLKNYLQYLNRNRPRPTPYFSREITSTGEAIDVQIDWTYLHDKKGNLTGYISILSDVTERRRYQQEIEKALSFERELNSLKTQFINTASHEFRTPLTVIIGSIQFVIKRYKQLSDETRSEYLQRVLDAGNQLSHLIDDMLNISRVDSGRISIIYQPLDLLSLVREIVEEMKLGSGHTHDFNLIFGQIERVVYLDRKILRHILTNLIFNAIKYSPVTSTIDIEISRNEERASISITDRGLGIPIEDQPYIFDAFHRGRNVKDIAGTGLGLNIVKKYVELLDGSICFSSQPEMGSTFTVSFPVRQKD